MDKEIELNEGLWVRYTVKLVQCGIAMDVYFSHWPIFSIVQNLVGGNLISIKTILHGIYLFTSENRNLSYNFLEFASPPPKYFR
jgi:hypothetical protein